MSAPGVLALALLLGPGGADKPGLRWEKGFDEALRKARAAGKPVLVDFWAEWCTWCHRLDETTYVDPKVVKLGEQFVAVKVDTEGGRKEQQTAERYDVAQLPTILFLSPHGRVLLRVQGFQGPGQFPGSMEKALQVAAKVMGWEAEIERDPRGSHALMKLGIHLFEQEFYEESRELLAKAAKADASAPADQRQKTRMLLGIIQTYDKKYSEAEDVLREALAIQPPGEHEARLLFVLARAYYNWGRYEKARAVLKRLLAAHPGSPVAAKARDTLAAIDKKKH